MRNANTEKILKINSIIKTEFLTNKKALYALFLALDAYYNSKYCKTMDFCEFCEFLNKKVADIDEA